MVLSQVHVVVVVQTDLCTHTYSTMHFTSPQLPQEQLQCVEYIQSFTILTCYSKPKYNPSSSCVPSPCTKYQDKHWVNLGISKL